MQFRTFAALAAVPGVGLLAAAGYFFPWVPSHSVGGKKEAAILLATDDKYHATQ